MTPQPPPDLTPVGLVTVLASTVFGPSVAAVVGPYVVIIIAAVGGAGAMIMQRNDNSPVRGMAYFFLAVTFSLMFTVPLTIGLMALWEPLRENWLYAPVSAALAYSADKWTTQILPWVSSKVNAFVDMWISTRSQK